MLAKVSAIALAAAPLVSAHGYLNGITANGVNYALAGPNWYYNQANSKDAGWRAGNQDSGFVQSSATILAGQAVSCGRAYASGAQTTTGALNAAGASIPVTAGTDVTFKWNSWANHPGPTLDYMAKCPGKCSDLTDASQLKWFKIRESGFIASAYTSSNVVSGWEASAFPASGGSQKVTIPAQLAAGEYVLRHEIIALHGAGSVGGSQLYPFCTNVIVSGGGSLQPSGVTGDKLYGSTDAGILVNIYQGANLKYTIPGPALASGVTNQPNIAVGA